MTIAFILPSLANKGPVIMAVELINYLVQQGHQCSVYYFDDITELEVPCSAKHISFFKKIDFNKYQIIHSHMFRPDVYCALYKSQISKSTKIISTIHIAIYEDLKYTHGGLKSFLTIPFWKAAWKNMDHIVVLTKTAKEYYKHIKLKKVSVINNGRDIPENPEPIPTNDLHLIKETKKNFQLLGSICVLDKRKGLEQILKLLVIHEDYAFIVVGDGIERTHLENLASRLGLKRRFHIIGSRKDGYRYLQYFDLFVIPSRSEGMPLALLEAMACKIPVVGSDITSFRNEYGDNKMKLFDLDDIDDLYHACKTALFDKDLMTLEAYNNYLKHYTVSSMAIKYLSLYQSLSANA